MTNLIGEMIHSTFKVLIFLCAAFTLANADDVSKPSAKVTPPTGVFVTRKVDDVMPFCLIGVNGDADGNRGWFAMSPENGSEAFGDTAAELVQYFSKLPPKRKKEGIFIWCSLTHLKDVDASKAHMTDYQKKLFAEPGWLEAERRYVAELATTCDRAGVSLWVNTAINGRRDDMVFQKLTQ